MSNLCCWTFGRRTSSASHPSQVSNGCSFWSKCAFQRRRVSGSSSSGHLSTPAGAINMPLKQLESRMDEVREAARTRSAEPGTYPVIVICRRGNNSQVISRVREQCHSCRCHCPACSPAKMACVFPPGPCCAHSSSTEYPLSLLPVGCAAAARRRDIVSCGRPERPGGMAEACGPGIPDVLMADMKRIICIQKGYTAVIATVPQFWFHILHCKSITWSLIAKLPLSMELCTS